MERNVSDGNDKYVSGICVAQSPHEPDPSFPQCYATERGSGDSGRYTVAQWNAYAMYELTARCFKPWALLKPFKSTSKLYESRTGTFDNLNSDQNTANLQSNCTDMQLL